MRRSDQQRSGQDLEPGVSPGQKRTVSRTLVAKVVLTAFVLAIWLPGLDTPFWGDDYQFLLEAHGAAAQHQSVWYPFWPSEKYKPWRPLSQQSYWRFVDSTLSGDPFKAHLLNFGLLVLASIGVGLLASVVAIRCKWPNVQENGVISALLYPALALHFLPVHWASAANSSVLVLFTTLCLSAWLIAPCVRNPARFLLWSSVPILLVLALLSKESAALTPLLMICLTMFVWRGAKPGRDGLNVWFLSCFAVVGWFIVRSKFASDPGSEYELVLGSNVFRNLAALVAWLLNVPREALRMIATGEIVVGLFWAATVALPFVASGFLVFRSIRRALDWRKAVATVAFVVIAYAPYFLLSWNSYAYYAAVAAILPVVVFARGLVVSRNIVPAVLLIGLSSMLSVQIARNLDHPGLIGRAQWAEQSLSELETSKIDAPLYVVSEDEKRFYAMGIAGLSWRLKINEADISVVDACPVRSSSKGTCLEVDYNGRIVHHVLK